MGTISAEQHKLFPSHQILSPNKPFRDLKIPPRKLLTRKTHQETLDVSPYETDLQEFLPYNDYNIEIDIDDELDPYSSDHFRMYEFKVRRCTRSRSHDWTDCPFAHPGEKARRRDLRRFHYSGAVCPEFIRGGCNRGENCEFAHGVFECWLHPFRYRTEACKDGKNCKRKVCFFAHSPRQLRILPEGSSRNKTLGSSPCSSLNHGHCCCAVCHSMTSSPTSTLLGMSPLSPPLSPSLTPSLSPVKHQPLSGFSPISRYSDRLSKFRAGVVSYKDVFTELMSSLEAMNFNEAAGVSSPMSLYPNHKRNVNNTPRNIDVSFDGEDQPQFILSPSTPTPNSSSFFNRDCSSNKGLFIDDIHKINDHNNGGLACTPDPDLGWVNELLM
ncbi:zinc finger CCCH domain-containing protein 2-like [Populus alba x Populus x berolinensis]|nr:zinc finger CCCH domain-containing protein 2-like [Populus alba x Populus x berolinensis]